MGRKTLNDEDIKLAVVDNLRWDSRLDSSKVEVTVEEGNVRLSGTVPTRLGKMAAMDQASSTLGVLMVKDDLIISEPEGRRREDEDQRLRDSVDWAIRAFASGEGADVHANVSNGTVDLHGSVTELWKANRIELVVANIGGVVEVRNHLAVVPTRKVTDEKLAAEITEAFSRNAFIDETSIDVLVANGVVTLSGTVASWFESKAVQEVVWGARGASKINVQLEIDQNRNADAKGANDGNR